MSKDKSSAPKVPTNYVVLQTSPEAVSFSKVGVYPAVTSDQAKRNAAQAMELQEGGSVTLVAVPEKSFQPKTFTVEVPKPRLVAA